MYGGNNWLLCLWQKLSRREVREDTLRVKALAPQEGAMPALWSSTPAGRPVRWIPTRGGLRRQAYLEATPVSTDHAPGLAWMPRGVRQELDAAFAYCSEYLPERMVLPLEATSPGQFGYGARSDGA